MPELLVPPNAFEAEQKLLGCFLRDSSSYAKVGAMIGSQDFYNKQHNLIYCAIIRLAEKQIDTEIVNVADKLDKWGNLKYTGGRAYLVELAGMVAGAAGILGYAEIVREKSQYRRLINTANQVVRSAYMQEQSPEELVGVLNTQSVAIVRTKDSVGFKKLSEFTNEAMMTIDKYDSGQQRGLTTGFQGLDELFAGFQPGDFIYVSARPSEGKTALTYNMAAKQAQNGSKVAYFSAETIGVEFAIRSLCTGAKVNSVVLKKGQLKSEQMDVLTLQNNKIAAWPIWLCDTPDIEINMLVILASQLHKEVGLDIIYVDYLQLLTTSSRFGTRKEQIDYISGSLRSLAKTLKIPVVVCCQLSREIEKRKNKEPWMSDQKESGKLEQDADIIIMPQRLCTIATRESDKKSKLVTLYVRKCRNGPTGQIDLTFEEKFTLFEEFPERELPF